MPECTKDRLLWWACIKTRAHSPAIISSPDFKLLYALKKSEIQWTCLFLSNNIFPLQEIRWST